MPRRATKVDANQAEIREAVRKCGYYWQDTYSVAQYIPGFPDALAVNKHAQTILFEVKMPGETLTDKEAEFHKGYPGLLFIVRSAEEALEYLGMRWV